MRRRALFSGITLPLKLGAWILFGCLAVGIAPILHAEGRPWLVAIAIGLAVAAGIGVPAILATRSLVTAIGTEEGLLVGNGLRWHRVPWTAVADLDTGWLLPGLLQMAWIRFAEPTPLGRRVTFLLPLRQYRPGRTGLIHVKRELPPPAGMHPDYNWLLNQVLRAHGRV